MIRLLFVVSLIGFCCWYLFSFKKQNREQQQKSLQRLALYGGIGVIALLILTGRISAIYAVAVGLIPWFERAALLQRMYKKYKGEPNDKEQKNNAGSSPATTQGMDLEEARRILGLKENLNELTLDSVNKAYKKLIQKNHPDSGGSEHLAQQIINARKMLIEYLSV